MKIHIGHICLNDKSYKFLEHLIVITYILTPVEIKCIEKHFNCIS